MTRRLVLPLLLPLVLAGCVAPEPPPAPRRVAAPAVEPPLSGKLERAPMADRQLKAPSGPTIVNIDGLKSTPKTAPPL